MRREKRRFNGRAIAAAAAALAIVLGGSRALAERYTGPPENQAALFAQCGEGLDMAAREADAPAPARRFRNDAEARKREHAGARAKGRPMPAAPALAGLAAGFHGSTVMLM